MREPSLVQVTERRQRWRRRLCAVLAPIVLLAGVWLGGHPQLLPGPVADALVDREGRVAAGGRSLAGDRPTSPARWSRGRPAARYGCVCAATAGR